MMKNKRYGDYKIVSEIGKGAFGSVYLAQKGDIYYAIKCIDKDRIIKENLCDNVKTEISLMKMINHPYIVKLCEVMSTQQKIILVMEYVEGGDLFAKITEQTEERLSEDDSRLYFQQIILAIEYCHGLKIIHRDLKPENILIDKNNNCIKISDFGLSTLLKSDYEKIQHLAGTLDYLAPEVLKHTDGYLGHPADIWGAGVILYNMVTGRNPFYHQDKAIKLKNIQTGTVEYPKYLSKSLIDLFKKIFLPKPRDRFTIKQIKKHPWFLVNFQPVIGYLQDKNNEIKFLDETLIESPKKDFKNTKSNQFVILIESIPIINCFELSSMLAGKWISKMFDPEPHQNLIIEYEKLSYEFLSDMHFEKFSKLIENYFMSYSNDVTYVSDNSGKYEIIINSFFDVVVLKFQIYKITDVKLIFSICYKTGNKASFIKIMKDFCDVNSENFKIF